MGRGILRSSEKQRNRETVSNKLATSSHLKMDWPYLNQLQFSSVQSLSRVWLSVTPWTAARQATLSITNSWSLVKLMSIESVIPSNNLILCHPLLPPPFFPSIRVFSNKSVPYIRWPNYWVSASASVLPINIQHWFPLGWIGCISL